jgi:protein-S-isoprenylcysteine O-methyltransferase Ste14
MLVQLGLAILGWSGFAAFFSHSPLAAMTAVTLVMGAISLFSGCNLSAGVREDRGNRWVLGAFSVLSILLAYIPAFTDRHNFLTIGGEAVRWTGFVLFVIGGSLRLWPVFVLGRRFSGLVAIQKDHTLVTTGIYSRIRNPSHLGLVIGSLGWALTFRAALGILITALMLIPLVARIRSEERRLRDGLAQNTRVIGREPGGCFPGSTSSLPGQRDQGSAHCRFTILDSCPRDRMRSATSACPYRSIGRSPMRCR